MDDQKIIFLLVGPKGSGKSFIGHLFEEHFGIRFIRVEDWAKRIKRNRDVHDDSYVREVFIAIEKGIVEAIGVLPSLVFESTGLTGHFDRMYSNLCSKFHVVPVAITADPMICVQRVRTRDQSIHIHVSDEEVRDINRLVVQKNLRFPDSIENTNKTKEGLIKEIENIINKNTMPDSGH
ncbi:hypothetical protein QQ008_02720 [Fulvivirgaceae bacterium BMA10]|uniref:Shikimate kinase n=1 Tax=Splendidivirga corallicola TaxID=3051826 RepID=A0ABT8KHR1_9BACT|nr:hypothetical protein [Fulvivirgaceae bacterium BMA10]